MLEYPKALYIGTVQSHSYKLAKNLEHESELRELGFVDFANLDQEQFNLTLTIDESPSHDSNVGGSKQFNNAFVPVERFNEVCEKLVQTETQLGAAQGERDFYIEENHKLKEQLGKSIEIKKETENSETNYSSMTSDQLRKILDEKGIKYLARDNKETLIALLTQPEKTEE